MIESLLVGITVYAFESIKSKQLWSTDALISAVEAGVSVGVADYINWMTMSSSIPTWNRVSSSLIAGLLYATVRLAHTKGKSDDSLIDSLTGEGKKESWLKNFGYLVLIAFVVKSIVRPVFGTLWVKLKIDPQGDYAYFTGVNAPLPTSNQQYPGVSPGSLPGYATGDNNLVYGGVTPLPISCGC